MGELFVEKVINATEDFLDNNQRNNYFYCKWLFMP